MHIFHTAIPVRGPKRVAQALAGFVGRATFGELVSSPVPQGGINQRLERTHEKQE